MNSLVRRFITSLRATAPLLAVLVALALAVPALAQDEDPFRRPGPATAGGPPPPPSPLDTLELRAVFDWDGAMFVVLVDTASSKSSFVKVGGAASDLAVSDLQAGDGSVLVRSGGKERRVTMRKAQIATMIAPPPIPQPGVPQVAGLPQPPPGQSGAMVDANVTDRMERVAQEIRRRREMRREMMERAQQQQPAQPQQ